MSKIKTNSSFLFIGNLVYAVCQWGMLVVYAKLGSPEVVGQFSLASAILVPMVMFANLQLRAIQATDAADKYSLDDFMAIRMVSLGIFFCLVAVVGVLFYRENGVLPVLFVLALAKGIEALNDVLYGYFQKHERMGFIARSMAIKGVSSLAIVAVIFHISKNLSLSLAALTLVWLGRMLFFDFPALARFESGRYIYHGAGNFLGRILKSYVDRKVFLKEILANGACLGMVMGLISLNTSTPRYIVDRLLGSRDLGFFAAMAYTSVAIYMFVVAVGQATLPRLARHFIDGDKAGFLKVLFRNIIVVVIYGSAGLVVVSFFGQKLLSIAYTKDYAAYNSVLILILLSSVVFSVASMLGYALTAIKCYVEQIPVFLAVILVNAALCYFLTPRFGLEGAAWGMVGGYATQAVLSIFLLSRKMSGIRDVFKGNIDPATH